MSVQCATYRRPSSPPMSKPSIPYSTGTVLAMRPAPLVVPLAASGRYMGIANIANVVARHDGTVEARVFRLPRERRGRRETLAALR